MNNIDLSAGDALIIVDLQNDFLPHGALSVPDGDAVVGPMNEYAARFAARGLPIVATRDWHPEDHCSFVEQGGTWPVHCVRDTPGAALSDALDLPHGSRIVSKADTADQDAYSGFQNTDLHEHLAGLGVGRVFVGGLATDYCVLNTVRDALDNGYETFLLVDASRGVDLTPGDSQRAIEEMLRSGAEALTLDHLG